MTPEECAKVVRVADMAPGPDSVVVIAAGRMVPLGPAVMISGTVAAVGRDVMGIEPYSELTVPGSYVELFLTTGGHSVWELNGEDVLMWLARMERVQQRVVKMFCRRRAEQLVKRLYPTTAPAPR